MRPLLDHLAAIFPIYYQPAQQISIDEMMIGTRCKVSFLQYLPKKPTRFGIKVWVNSEAKSGYVLSLQIYSGAADNREKKGLANRVVMDLVQMYEGKNHFLYVDNFTPALPYLSTCSRRKFIVQAPCVLIVRDFRKVYFPQMHLCLKSHTGLHHQAPIT